MNPSKTQNTIEVENIEVVYKLEEKKIHAVKDASFNVTERKGVPSMNFLIRWIVGAPK